jgi:hypothetical protein
MWMLCLCNEIGGIRMLGLICLILITVTSFVAVGMISGLKENTREIANKLDKLIEVMEQGKKK